MLYIELPASVELVVSYTEPGLPGDRSTGGTKPATLETGHEIQVPLFINQGEKIKVDTRDSSLPGSRQVLMVGPVQGPQAGARRALRSELRGRGRRSTALDERVDGRGARPTNDYTVDPGARRRRAPATRIDELLATYSEGWTLDRMPAVDRNVLRIGVYEMLYVDDVPDAVAVSEAMALVRDLSTDESPAFVNGVLGAILRNKAAILG